MVRYAFIVRDLHPLLLAGLPVHTRLTHLSEVECASQQLKMIPEQLLEMIPEQLLDHLVGNGDLHFTLHY